MTCLPRGILAVLLALAALSIGAPGRAAERSDDFKWVRTYVQLSASVPAAGKARQLHLLEEMERRGADLGDLDFLLGLMRIVAIADNGHDSVNVSHGWLPNGHLPIRIAWLADGPVVARAGPEALTSATSTSCLA